MPTDSALLVAGSGSLPLSYTVPNAQEIITLSARAVIDGSAAATPFLPVVQLVSDAGIILAEAFTDATVAAGGSAQVSWFPRVGAAASSTGASLDTGMIRRERGGQVIPSGAETLVAFSNLQSYHAGTAPIVTSGHALDNPLTFTTNAVALVMTQAQYPTGGGTSRYIRVAFTNGQEAANSDVYSENIEQLGIIGAASFNDLMVVSTFLVYGRASAGGPFGGPTQLHTFAFQTSGATRNVFVTQTILMLPVTV